METIERGTCEFKGQRYSRDMVVCTTEGCMLCNQGEWKDRNSNPFSANYPERL
jgi:hypothetical protein